MLSLLPDTGHALASLRIAMALREPDSRLAFIAPIELIGLAARVAPQIEQACLGRVRPKDADASLARLCRASSATRRLYLDTAFYRSYFAPLIEAAHGQLNEMIASVRQFRPTLVVADDHLFPYAYRMAASAVGAPLILCNASGSHWRAQRVGPWSGYRAGARGPDAGVRLLSRLWDGMASRFGRSLQPQRWRVHHARHERLRREWEAFERVLHDSRDSVIKVSCGMGALESLHLGQKIVPTPDVAQFGPLPVGRSEPISASLVEWLEAVDRPVVYVSFGTMSPSVLPFADAIVDGALHSGARVLWASARRPWSGEYAPRDVRWEAWVSQPAILAHRAVSAFISHGGSGAMQESGWAGKPVVCVPLVWDQPYNAWVAQELGFGCQLSKHLVGRSSVRRALAQVPKLRQGSLRISAEFEQLNAEGALREHFRTLDLGAR